MRTVKLSKEETELYRQRAMFHLSMPIKKPARRKQPRKNAEQVYFAWVGCNVIKIGFSANLKQRMNGLKSASDDPIKFITAIKGGRSLETDLKKRFSFCKKQGEHFHAVPELLEYITSLDA